MSISEKITTTTEYNGNNTSTIGENNEDHDGIQTIIIYILIGLAIIIVLTTILCVYYCKVVKKNNETEVKRENIEYYDADLPYENNYYDSIK